MKKQLLLLAALLCFASLAWANFGYQIVEGPVVVAAPATSYLVEENAEGTGTPSGWADTGTHDWDYTTTALRGSQSLSITENYGTTTSPTFSATANVNAFIRFRTDSIPASSSATFLQIRDGSTVLCYLRLIAGTGVIRGYHGTAYGASSAISVDTTYYIWAEYASGSGADGTLDVYIDTDNTKPASPSISVTTGTTSGDPDNIKLLKDNGEAHNFIFDQIIVDDATIGDVDA